MTPSEVGERAEAAVVAALVHSGKSVCLPFRASGRCDLIFEDRDGLHRMQVKNGVLRNNAVRFATCSNTGTEPRTERELPGPYVRRISYEHPEVRHMERIFCERKPQRRALRRAESDVISGVPALGSPAGGDDELDELLARISVILAQCAGATTCPPFANGR